MANEYGTRAKLKARLQLPSADTLEDTTIDELLIAASRAVDTYCRRRFFATTETRYYTPDGPTTVEIDDLTGAPTVSIDEAGARAWSTTLSATTDYWLEPVNAAVDGQPFTLLRVDPVNGRYDLPDEYPRSVKVAGDFGYCADGAHPLDVEEATLRVAVRLYALPSAPLGVAQSAGDGAALRIVREDYDVARLLAPYRREWVFA